MAIETSRGLLVACLRATGRRVYAINPMAVSRYRDRYSVHTAAQRNLFMFNRLLGCLHTREHYNEGIACRSAWL